MTAVDSILAELDRLMALPREEEFDEAERDDPQEFIRVTTVTAVVTELRATKPQENKQVPGVVPDLRKRPANLSEREAYRWQSWAFECRVAGLTRACWIPSHAEIDAAAAHERKSRPPEEVRQSYKQRRSVE